MALAAMINHSLFIARILGHTWTYPNEEGGTSHHHELSNL
jgi:hypothetical protein